MQHSLWHRVSVSSVLMLLMVACGGPSGQKTSPPSLSDASRADAAQSDAVASPAPNQPASQQAKAPVSPGVEREALAVTAVTLPASGAVRMLPEAELIRLRNSGPDFPADPVPVVDFPEKLTVTLAPRTRNILDSGITDALLPVWQAWQARNGGRMMEILDGIEIQGQPPAALRYELTWLRIEALTALGELSGLDSLLTLARDQETGIMGSDALSRLQEARIAWQKGDRAGAEEIWLTLLSRKGQWRLPLVSDGRDGLILPESDFETRLKRLQWSRVQREAHAGLAIMRLEDGNPAQAAAHAARAEDGFNALYIAARKAEDGEDVDAASPLPLMPRDHMDRAGNLVTLVAARIMAGEGDAADPDLIRARKLFAQFTASGALVETDARIALALARQGNLEAARSLADRAARQAAELDWPDMIWPLEGLRGRLLQADGKNERALLAWLAAEAALHRSSGGLALFPGDSAFGTTRQSVAEYAFKLQLSGLSAKDPAAARIDLDAGAVNALVRSMEGARLRPLWQAARTAGLPARGESKTLELLRGLERDIRTLRLRRIAGGLEPTPLVEDALALAVKNGQALESKRRALLENLSRSQPVLAEFAGGDLPPLLAMVAGLKEQDRLAYFLPARGADPLVWLVINAEGKGQLYRIPMNAEDLWARLTELRRLIESGQDEDQFLDASDLADQMQVDRFAGDGILYVVPHNDGHFLPWGAMSEDRTVALLPSGRWLVPAENRDAEKAGALPVSAGHGLVFGPPSAGQNWTGLDEGLEEANAIAAHYKSQPARGFAATAVSFRQTLKSSEAVQALHIASRLRFSADSPLQSGVVMGGGDRLVAADLLASPLGVPFLTISEGETDFGRVSAEPDYLLFAEMARLGGTRTIVTSLWPAPATLRRAFLDRLHSRLAAGKTVQDAWSEARQQLTALNAPPSASGAFVLLGLPGDKALFTAPDGAGQEPQKAEAASGENAAGETTDRKAAPASQKIPAK